MFFFLKKEKKQRKSLVEPVVQQSAGETAMAEMRLLELLIGEVHRVEHPYDDLSSDEARGLVREDYYMPGQTVDCEVQRLDFERVDENRYEHREVTNGCFIAEQSEEG
jgi:hypothetical protein